LNSYITVFSVKNSDFVEGDTKKCDFKVIVFHCLDVEHQMELTKNTQFCVVGDFLCHRIRSQRLVWVTRLKAEAEDFIPESSLQQTGETSISQLFEKKSFALPLD